MGKRLQRIDADGGRRPMRTVPVAARRDDTVRRSPEMRPGCVGADRNGVLGPASPRAAMAGRAVPARTCEQADKRRGAGAGSRLSPHVQWTIALRGLGTGTSAASCPRRFPRSCRPRAAGASARLASGTGMAMMRAGWGAAISA